MGNETITFKADKPIDTIFFYGSLFTSFKTSANRSLLLLSYFSLFILEHKSSKLKSDNKELKSSKIK